MLILVFIFLTPKSWFETTGFREDSAAVKTFVAVDVVGTQLDRAEIERRARIRAQKPTGQITERRELHDSSGKVIAYEVDIR